MTYSNIAYIHTNQISLDSSWLHTGTNDYKQPINHHTLSELEDQFCEEPQLVCHQFRQLAEAILIQNNLSPPVTFLQALEVYFILLQAIEAVI